MKTLFILLVLVLTVVAYMSQRTSPAPLTEPATETPAKPTQETPTSADVTIDMSDRGLTSLTTTILSNISVQTLNLSNNKLSGALPAEIRKLSNLEVLNISNNDMTGLPAELGQLSKLRVLDVSHNKLTGIPHELGNLQRLEILNLTGNNISQFDLDIIREKLPRSTRIIE